MRTKLLLNIARGISAGVGIGAVWLTVVLLVFVARGCLSSGNAETESSPGWDASAVTNGGTLYIHVKEGKQE